MNIGHYGTEYAYDALGRRIEKRTGGDATRYIYDGARVVEEWTISSGGSPTLAASYVYGLYVDEVLTMRRGGNDYYYHGDDMHNVVKLTDSNGDVVEAYDYGDYGQPEFYDATGDRLDVTASPLGNPYLFAGREFDAELGYYYFRNRYMDPGLGRFVSRDPLGLWGDPLNLGNGYTYAASNPWSLVDPFGLESGGNLRKFVRGIARSLWDMGLMVLEADKLMKNPDYLAERTLETGEEIFEVAGAIKDDPLGAATAVRDAAKDKIENFGWEDAGYLTPDLIMSIKGGVKSIGALADVIGSPTDLVRFGTRGNGGRGGGPAHARVQKEIQFAAGGDQEAPIHLGDTGRLRIADVVDSRGRIHQVGDMRWRGGFRPSARERGAIEEMRRANPLATIIYHDRLGRYPTLINPDLQPGWEPAPKWHRRYK